MYEHYKKPMLPRKKYFKRLLFHFFLSFLLVVFSLLMGIFGYHFFCDLSYADALLNASMILTGMGPVDPLTTVKAKVFASFYALYSGIAFLTMIAIILAPILHRFLHSLHLEE